MTTQAPLFLNITKLAKTTIFAFRPNLIPNIELAALEHLKING